MAGSSVIGALRVNLGLDSALFKTGAKQATGMVANLQRSLAKFGKSASELGAKMSVLSAGIAAVGAAGFALAKTTADAGTEISRQAKVANSGVVEFQRWAAASKSVGIQQDKLSDILKDVNDRVGDFNATGAGPMKDFFDNIGPKVGVTAENFKNLSGPQALQLYVSSLQKAGLGQQEMTFYLEAMASDATALIPLLANGGAELNRLADAAQNAGGIMSESGVSASVAFNEKLGLLMTSVDGLRNRIGEALMPIMTQFMDVLISSVIPALGQMVTHVQSAIEWFGSLPGPVQEAAAVIATVLGVGGPILLAVGAMSTAFSLIIAGTGPIGLFIAAAVLLAAAWAKWGDDIMAAIGPVVTWIVEKFTMVKNFLTENGAAIARTMIGPIGVILAAWDKWGEDVKVGIGAAVDWIIAKFNGFIDFMKNLPAQLMQIGSDMIQGLLDGIMAKWGDLKAKVQELTAWMPDWMRRENKIQSPSRVFREIGQFITEGLGLGISDNRGMVQDSMRGIGDAINGGGDSLSSGIEGFGKTASDVFRAVAIEGKSLSSTLRDMASGWLSGAAGKLFDGAMGSLFGGIPEHAGGTNNFVGGLARVNERGGEIMNLPSGTQIIPNDISKRMASNSGGQTVIRLEMSPDIEARILQQSGAQTVQMVRAADRSLPDRMRQINNNPRVRR